MCSGNAISQAQRRMGSCRRSLGSCQGSGSCNNPQNGGQGQGGKAASGWGVGTTPYGTTGGPQAPNSSSNDPSEDPNDTAANMRDYQQIYNPSFMKNQSYETQVHGQETGEGGSLVYIEKTDPQTGETSYVPYFALQPSDMQSLMDSIEDQEIPRSYQDLVRSYFQQLTGGAQSTGDKKEGE
jgi:hypothetical protein